MELCRPLLLALLSWQLMMGLGHPMEDIISPNNTTTSTIIETSLTNATKKTGWNSVANQLFDYTGVYISDQSVLSPLVWLGHIMRGLFLTAMGDPKRMKTEFTEDLCDITCSSGLARVLAVVGCGGSALGLLDNSFILDYISSNVICPVSLWL